MTCDERGKQLSGLYLHLRHVQLCVGDQSRDWPSIDETHCRLLTIAREIAPEIRFLARIRRGHTELAPGPMLELHVIDAGNQNDAGSVEPFWRVKAPDQRRR